MSSESNNAASASAAAAAAASAQPTPAAASPVSPPAEDVLVQYVVMRGDLIKAHKWNVGGLIANGSHACVAAIMQHLQDDEVRRYTSADSLGSMRKVVLSAKDEQELIETAEKLQNNNIKHHVWVEHPENYRSCLAVRPYPRSIIQPLLKHLKLFR